MAIVRKGEVAEAPLREGPAPRDHNQPPMEERIPAEFREALLSERPDFFQKLDDLLGTADPDAPNQITGSVDRAKCTNEDEFGLCGRLVNTLRAAGKLVDEVHKAQKAPYLEAGRLVDAQKNALVDRIKRGMASVETLQKDYAREQDRIAEAARAKAEADRRALEEAAKEKGLEHALPPVQPNDPAFFAPKKAAPLRTDGATVSTGKEWVIDSVDVVKAIKHCKTNSKVIEAITAAMKAMVKSTGNNGGKGFTGVEARQDVAIRNR